MWNRDGHGLVTGPQALTKKRGCPFRDSPSKREKKIPYFAALASAAAFWPAVRPKVRLIWMEEPDAG
jgi:hypothetical protein